MTYLGTLRDRLPGDDFLFPNYFRWDSHPTMADLPTNPTIMYQKAFKRLSAIDFKQL